MSLNETLEKDYITAYKTHDQERVGVLRLLKTAIKNRLVAESRPHDKLSDAEVLEIIIKEAKQRQDAIEQFQAANRKDLADREAAELEILKGYLPKALGPEEVAAVIDAAIAETGASGPKNMGRVMGVILAKHKGQVDGKELSAAVKERLAKM